MFALSQSLSIDSSATTLVDGSDPSGHPYTPHPDQPIDPETPACWRVSGVESTMTNGDIFAIQRIQKYRPFNDEYALMRRDLFVPQPIRRLTSDLFEQITIVELSLAEEIVSGLLDRVTRAKFHEVPFEDWVKQALGLSPCSVMNLEISYLALSNRLHRFIVHHNESPKFKKIAEILEETNPFASLLITNACTRITPWRLGFDFTSIINPLQEVLSDEGDISIVLQRLEVLAVRFHCCYSNALLSWPKIFNIATPFLSRLRSEKTKDIVISITRGDLEQFHGIDSSGVHQNSSHLRSLNSRWNSLSETVRECAAAKEFQEKLIKLATAFKHIRNFYSMSAVLQGLLSADIRSHELKRMIDFIDQTGNYEKYRRRIDTEPALHFLFPLVKAVRMGDDSALSAIYQFRQYKFLGYM